MPDGSEHELRPIDYSPYTGSQDFLKGYYKESPYQMGTMRYFSFDGSFLYATVTTEGNWTVYMPDGTRIIQTPDGLQRIQDTETATLPLVRFTCSESSQSYTRTRSKGWGALSQIMTPSGATLNYAYSLDTFPFVVDTDKIAEESIKQKKITHDGGTIDTWVYTVQNDAGSVTNPDGSTITEKKYTHSPGFSFSTGKAGLSYSTTRPFSKTERHWIDMPFSGVYLDSPGGPINFNPVVDMEYTTLLNAANSPLKMSAKAFQYDYNGNVLQTTDYDWFDPALVSRDAQGVPTGVPGNATVLRVTNNSYYNPATTSTSGNVYAKRLLSTATPLIVNASQQTAIGPSITQYSYDGQAYGTAPIVGNVTTVSRLDDRGDSLSGPE